MAVSVNYIDDDDIIFSGVISISGALQFVAGRIYLVAIAQQKTGATPPGNMGVPTDDWGHTYVPLGAAIVKTVTNTVKLQVWAFAATSTQGYSFIQSVPGSPSPSDARIVVLEVDGADPLALSNYASAVANAAATLAPSVTLASAPSASSALVGFMMASGGSSRTPPTGFTEDREIGSSNALEVVHDLLSTTQTTAWPAQPSGTAEAIGFVIELRALYKLSAAVGSYALSGQTVALKHGRKMSLAVGSYALTGAAVTLQKAYSLVMDAGAYALTGVDLVMRYPRVLAAEVGDYLLTGVDVALLRGKTLAAAVGSYAVTGAAVALTATRRFALVVGNYAVTGVTPVLRSARMMALATGSYAVTGSAVALVRSKVLAAAVGSYALTGAAVSLRAGRRLGAAVGAYVLAGLAVVLTAIRSIRTPADRRSYLRGGLAARQTALSGTGSRRSRLTGGKASRSTRLTEI